MGTLDYFRKAYDAMVKRPTAALVLIGVTILYAVLAIVLILPAIVLPPIIVLFVIFIIVTAPIVSLATYKIIYDNLLGKTFQLNALVEYIKQKILSFTAMYYARLLILMVPPALLFIPIIFIAAPAMASLRNLSTAALAASIALAVLSVIVFFVLSALFYFSYALFVSRDTGAVESLKQSLSLVMNNKKRSVKFFLAVAGFSIVYIILIFVLSYIPCLGYVVQILGGVVFDMFIEGAAFAFVADVLPQNTKPATKGEPSKKTTKEPKIKKK